MIRFKKVNKEQKDEAMLTVAPKADTIVPAGNMAEITDRLGLPIAPAAWPTGVSLLAQAVDACQRCDATDVCSDWLVRAPKAISKAPAFCPNASEFARVKKATSRD
jgi:hypothetical protein